MKTDKAHMRDALPHIERAQRTLDMLRHFVENKDKLSLDKRVPNYYNILVNEVIAIQDSLLTDGEYTERVLHNLSKISENREFAYRVTVNNKGEQFYSIEAMLPLKQMKNKVLFGGRTIRHV